MSLQCVKACIGGYCTEKGSNSSHNVNVSSTFFNVRRALAYLFICTIFLPTARRALAYYLFNFFYYIGFVSIICTGCENAVDREDPTLDHPLQYTKHGTLNICNIP